MTLEREHPQEFRSRWEEARVRSVLGFDSKDILLRAATNVKKVIHDVFVNHKTGNKPT